MFTIANRTQESDARAYCHRLGLDADEVVAGYERSGMGSAVWTRKARWRWYLGVSEAALRRSY